VRQVQDLHRSEDQRQASGKQEEEHAEGNAVQDLQKEWCHGGDAADRPLRIEAVPSRKCAPLPKSVARAAMD
jgi:hypothetical protein